MRRRRRQEAEAFGTSLADILTTALGCVLLLFMVAVMHIRTTLSREQDAREKAAQALALRSADLNAAQAAADAARGRQQAAEAALAEARAAAAAAGAAHAQALQDRDDAQRQADARAAELDSLRADHERLRDAARVALAELDPRTASPVDVMLVIDGTRSMQANLDATRANLRATLDALRVVSPTARVGVVVFRDRNELPDLRLQSHRLTADEAELGAFLAGIEATSTKRDRDLPEWLCGGLEAAVDADWRADAIKLVIGVSDAGSQAPDAAPCLRLAADFSARGGQVHMLSARPRGYGRSSRITRHFEGTVLDQHARIAAAGGGVHVQADDSNALLQEVLRAAFRSRTAQPLDSLRRAVDAAPPGVE